MSDDNIIKDLNGAEMLDGEQPNSDGTGAPEFILSQAQNILDKSAEESLQALPEEAAKELVLDPKAVAIAVIVHEAIRTLQKVNGEHQYFSWDDTEQHMQLMTIRMVMFLMEYKGAQPSSLHAQWCREMFLLGWKVGIEYDWRKKEHNCLIPWEDLSDFDWVRYKLFCGIVNALI